jgi:hypothetical protein
MPVYNNNNKTFQEFTDYYSCTVINIKNMERIKAHLNSGTNTQTRGSRIISYTTTLAIATPSVDNTTAHSHTTTASLAPSNNLNNETRKHLISKGKYFIYFQVRYTSHSCPIKQAAHLKVLEWPIKPTPELENKNA